MIPGSIYITLGKFLYDAVSNTSKDVEKGDITELKKEEALQEISMRMAERQAKVAQELAIADRIKDAEEVSIEEYYDNSLEGSAGIGVSETGVNIGANGKTGAVSKRIYRFSNFNKETLVVMQDKS
ncbi:MAG: hypothetical protein ACTH3B_06210 [Pseudoalteromonas sp.]